MTRYAKKTKQGTFFSRETGFCLAAALAFHGTAAPAKENLVSNPGFESSKTVAINVHAATPTSWEIVARRGGYDIETGEQVLIPVSWGLNPDDGWGEHPDKHSYTGKFRYVTGTAGEAVHSGEHAVYIASNTHATVCSNAGFSVVSKLPSGGKKQLLPMNEPFHFSFYAKGKGTISCAVYTYLLDGKTNYSARKVTPESFVLTDQWQKFEGAMQFTDPDVVTASGIVFAIDKGEATIDDVTMFNGEPDVK